MVLRQADIPHSSKLLRSHFLARREKNSAYSIRAFARDSGLSQAFLSYVLKGERRLSIRKAVAMSAKLKLAENERDALLQAVAHDRWGMEIADAGDGAGSSHRYRAEEEEFAALAMDQFEAISNWYHLAILDLTFLKQFKPEVKWIASSLGITTVEAREAIERLSRLGLLDTREKRWKKSKRKIVVPTSRSVDAVRAFHRQMISKALAELDRTDSASFARREISGYTVTVDPRKIPEARKLIARFQARLAEFLMDGEPSDLYQINVQFFSLLKKKERKPA